MSHPPAAEARSLMDQGRRTVLGYLAPMILHETNNVLTVLAGIRQLLKLGRDLPERVGPMIDAQMVKMEGLLEWLRGLGPSDPTEMGIGADTAGVARDLEALLGLAGKGRRLGLAVTGGEVTSLQPASAEALLLACLCAVLPALPARTLEQRAEITVGLGIAAGRVRAALRLDGDHGDPRETPEFALAGSLAAAVGGELKVAAATAAALSLEVELPA